MENPVVSGTGMETNEIGNLAMPPKEYAVVFSAEQVRGNGTLFTRAGTYDFVEDKDGKYKRIAENGEKYPPIEAKKMEEIAKIRAHRKLTNTRVQRASKTTKKDEFGR